MGIEVKFGFDLGTTNSCIAYHDGTSTKVLMLEHGKKTLPSCVMYDKGKVIVGQEAYEQRFLVNQVIYSTKRDIGTNKVYHINDGEREFDVTPVDVSAEILKKMKSLAEKRFQSTVNDVVITVPAYFNDRQKKDTLAAGVQAGFQKVSLAVEPSAAASAYTINARKPEQAVVYDLGGGTFDVSLVSITPPIKQEAGGLFDGLIGSNNSLATIEVIAIEGDNRLGGDDFDQAIFNYVIKEMNTRAHDKYGAPKKWDFGRNLPPEERERLLLNIEGIKKIFTKSMAIFSLPVEIKFPTFHFKESMVINEEVMRVCFNKVFQRTLRCFDTVLGKTLQPVRRVILIGGSTKFALMRDMFQDTYPDLEISSNLSPDYSVAIGAAMIAAANTDMAAIKLMDIVPQNIGIKVDKIGMGVRSSDRFEVIIPKSSNIPAEFGMTFKTESPEQTTASLEIFEGDSLLAEENSPLGKLFVEGIVPKKDAPTNIHVRLAVDINGLLRVKALFDDQVKELELINVVTSSDRLESEEDRLLLKKWARFMRLLEGATLTAEEQAIVDSTKKLWDEGQRELSPEFMEIIHMLQQLHLKNNDRIRQNILTTSEQETAEAEEPEDDRLEPLYETVHDKQGNLLGSYQLTGEF